MCYCFTYQHRAGAMVRLAEMMMADPKNHEQMKASQLLCTGLADALEVVVSTAISSKGAADDAAAIDFLGSFCRYCTQDLLTMVLLSSHIVPRMLYNDY